MKRILYTLLTLFCLSLLTSLSAQPNYGGRGGGSSAITGKITGTLIDTATQVPVEFATVVVINAETDKEVNGMITDENGAFKIIDLPLAAYKVVISFLGYEPKTISGIELTPKEPDADLGQIQLVSESLTLSEVEVTGEAALVENKIDKIVYNAEKDVANRGGDASDVLRRVPLLSVDLEGNVSLRGSQNVQILINGRPSGMFASSVADALKTIPADQIKNVEVITTPSAKYDGEGSAGIINIVTKKKTAEGFSGSVNGSLGNVQNNATASLNIARGRFGFNSSGSTFFSWPRESNFSFLRENYVGDQVITLQQGGPGESQYTGFGVSAGAFYDINAYNSINSNFRLNGRKFGRDNDVLALFNDPVNDIQQEYTRVSESDNLSSGFDWTTDYKKKFKKEEQELVFAFQLTGNFDDRENDILQEAIIGDPSELNRNENNINDGVNLEYTGQVDYTHPFSEKVKLETGAKAVIRRIESDFQYNVFDTNENAYLLDQARSDVFDYFQDVYAGYASFNLKFGENYGLIAGARYEYTDISGEFDRTENPFANDYDNFLPSIIVSRKFKNFQTLKASYVKRIQRPSLRFVNPFVDLSDPRNISFGNPQLAPEISDQYEIGYNTFVKGVSINASTYFRRTTGIIESFLKITDEGISETTFQNIGENNSFGLNLFSSITIKKIVTIRGGFNVFTYDGQGTIGGETLSNQAVLWNGNLSGSITLPWDVKFEAFGFYRSPRQTLQGFNPSFSIFSFGLQKEVFEKRGTIGLRVVEPFNKFKDFPSELEGPNFRQETTFSVLFRSFGVNFSYRFGSLNFKERQRRSSIQNDDQKSGGDQQF